MNLTPQRVALCGILVSILLCDRWNQHGFGQAVQRKSTETRRIDSPGVPGPVVAFGEQSRVLAVGRRGDSFAPVVVAGQMPGNRSGRIVLFGHDGYFSNDSLGLLDTRPFFFDAAKWASRKGNLRSRKSGRPTVGLIGLDDLAAAFTAEGWDVKQLGNGWPSQLANLDLVVSTASAVTNPDRTQAIERFVNEGGGWLVGITGWGWEQTHPGQSLAADLPIAPILAKAGLAISNETLEPAETKDRSMTVIQADELPLVHAGKALEKLASLSKSKSKPGPDEAPQIATSLELALSAIGSRETPFRKALSELVTGQSSRTISKTRPIRKADMIERIAVRILHDLAKADSSQKITPDPSAADFPGSVPAEAARITRKIRFNAGSKGRLGTGLYAPPGGSIRLRKDGEPIPDGLQVRIGAHGDTLWHLDRWERHPEITRVQEFRTASAELRMASPFGGLVYLEAEKPLTEDLTMDFEGVVQAPHYVLGSTTKDEWGRLRQAPAPWAELRSRHVGLVLPSDSLRNLTDPKPLLELWDRVMDCQNELGPLRREFAPTQWIVPDRQISAGYMHAGNPIMTWLDAVPFFASAEKLLTDNPGGITWGILHEIGHNRQRNMWTPEGLGEVTNNLFALYAYDKLLGQPSAGHPSLLKSDRRADALKKYRATGPDFEVFKDDPFLALAFFMEIQEAFGWEPFIAHFAACEKLERSKAPRSDEDRWDLWLAGLSKASGHNLTAHFETWGIPVSATAIETIKDLPKWNPIEP